MYAKRIAAPTKVNLESVSTDENGGLTKEEGAKRFAELDADLYHLQELLHAAGINGLLVVVQGRDAAGKDGTMDKIAGTMNPVGVRIASFKVPTPLEAEHDFLWRVHQEAPGRGEIVFFNRSHYEDVLVTRVHKLITSAVCKKRYDDIRQFEQLLFESGIVVLKFYLHLSKDEQKKRLLARETRPEKAWKMNPEDWKERAHWDAYTTAYEDALGATAAEHAPWYVVPADRKWYRDLAIAQALVDALQPYKKIWMKKLDALEKTQRAALEQLRNTGAIEKV